jgi:hypothetical protein
LFHEFKFAATDNTPAGIQVDSIVSTISESDSGGRRHELERLQVPASNMSVSASSSRPASLRAFRPVSVSFIPSAAGGDGSAAASMAQNVPVSGLQDSDTKLASLSRSAGSQLKSLESGLQLEASGSDSELGAVEGSESEELKPEQNAKLPTATSSSSGKNASEHQSSVRLWHSSTLNTMIQVRTAIFADLHSDGVRVGGVAMTQSLGRTGRHGVTATAVAAVVSSGSSDSPSVPVPCVSLLTVLSQGSRPSRRLAASAVHSLLFTAVPAYHD